MGRARSSICYACDLRIGLVRSVLGAVTATFESAFDGTVSAVFCSAECRDDAIANAAAVRKTFPPPAPRPCDQEFLVTER